MLGVGGGDADRIDFAIGDQLAVVGISFRDAEFLGGVLGSFGIRVAHGYYLAEIGNGLIARDVALLSDSTGANNADFELWLTQSLSHPPGCPLWRLCECQASGW